MLIVLYVPWAIRLSTFYVKWLSTCYVKWSIQFLSSSWVQTVYVCWRTIPSFISSSWLVQCCGGQWQRLAIGREETILPCWSSILLPSTVPGILESFLRLSRLGIWPIKIKLFSIGVRKHLGILEKFRGTKLISDLFFFTHQTKLNVWRIVS